MKPFATLDALLHAHGLRGLAEEPLDHTGFSGAKLTRIRRPDGESFILKRLSIERDWIMLATDDIDCREAAFASSGVSLPDGILIPSLGTAIDGEEHALLMRDITPHLLPPGPITEPQLEVILHRIAELHRWTAPEGAFPWCSLEKRLTLLTPTTALVAAANGAPVARDLIEGWDAFDRHASPAAQSLIRGLFADLTPLLRALSRVPAAFLHGDLKFDNIGLDSDDRMWLIDWAMTLVAPPAVELGWFLAINSRRLPVSLDDVMIMYANAAELGGAIRERHDALTAVCGLLLRGWRKALDAEEGEPDELRWWCEHVEAVKAFL